MATSTVNRSPQGKTALMPQNGVVPFQNETLNCTVRAVVKDGEPWFIAKDICEALGYGNSREALSKHVREKWKADVTIRDTSSNGTIQNRNIQSINEAGLFALVMKSKMPKAVEFQDWVCEEVLPSIRKHGAYATEAKLEEMLADPDTMILTLQALKTEQEKRKVLETQAEQNAPKVLFTDAVMSSRSSISIRELARFLHQNHIDIGQNRLYKRLRADGYLCKSGVDHNLPTQRAMELGLFEIKKGTYIDSNGANVVTRTTKVTGKGQVYFVTKFLGRPAEAV